MLEEWRARRPEVPARKDNDALWEGWASLEEQAVRWFGAHARASGAFTAEDREHLLDWIDASPLGIDAVDAVAWGLDVATSPTFASAWREELCANGDVRHELAEGQPYPVAEAHWGLPATAAVSSRPSALSPPTIDELPHVRIHSDHGFRLVADFGLEADLRAVGAGLRVGAALHPNEHLTDFKFCRPSRHIVFPVRLRDPVEQQRHVLALVEGVLRERAQICVLPELSTNPEIVEAIAALVDEADDPHLVIAGSYHAGEGETARNECVGLVPEGPQRLRHRKVVPFSDDLGLDPPWREGIAVDEPPELTIYHADRFRFCLLTCKDFLDGAVARALGRVAANVICVPAMSAKTDAFVNRAAQHVAESQAVVLMANGPLRWEGGDPVEPAAVLGQPVRGGVPVEASMSPAPVAALFKFGTRAVDRVT
ncbi:MAG: hypothetical protein QOJ29_984 [Thermoleophilaceae bacterium]|nr:hypothetical protein [Thermoleophilaceae bacterium]